jgi:hypothetical protein
MTRSRRLTAFSRGAYAAGCVALLAVGTSLSATGADLDYRSVPNDRYGSAYEDPRYADLYAPTPPRRPVIEHHAYGHAPIPQEPVYRQDGYRHDEPRYDPRYHDPAPPRTYGYQAYPPAAPRYAERPGCTSPRAAQRALEQEGWRDFANLTLRGEIAVINARRPDGRGFELQLNRCTGDLVSVRPLDQRPYGPRVYGEYRDPRAF